MTKLEKKLIKFIEWFIILQPVLDVLTSITVRYTETSLTIGMITRMFFAGFVAIYIFFIYDGAYRKTLSIFLAAVCAYGVASLMVSAYYNGFGTIIENFKMFFKMYYFLFALIFFFALYLKYRYTVKNWILAAVFLEYTSSIFLSAVTNTSFVTYDYARGYCGWFYAGNEVGAIISVLAIVALIVAMKSKNIPLKIATSVLLSFASVYVGTKVPFMACTGAVVVLAILMGVRALIGKDRTALGNFVYALCSLVLIVVLFYCNSPMKYNSNVMLGEHYDSHITDKLQGGSDSTDSSVQTGTPSTGGTSAPSTDSVTTPPSTDGVTTAPSTDSVTTPPSTDSVTTAPSTDSVTTPPSDSTTVSPSTDSVTTPSTAPVAPPATGDPDGFAHKMFLVANWLLSNRLIMIEPAFVAYTESSTLQQLFGMGYYFSTSQGVYDNLIEMDFIALVINHGIIGCLLYMLPLAFFAIFCIKYFFKNIRKFFSMTWEVGYIYSILIALGCAFLAGHVLVAPAVSIYLAVIIVNLYAALDPKRDELLTGNSTEEEPAAE